MITNSILSTEENHLVLETALKLAETSEPNEVTDAN
tara:strand:+ start:276 stop:383 length:108 start_codon:yes stop_codon:yes gene_type:complete